MTSNLPKKGEFFELRPDARRRGKGHGVFFENESSLKTPPNFLLRPDQGASRLCARPRAWCITQAKGGHRRILKLG